MDRNWTPYKPEGRTAGKAAEAGDRMAAGLENLLRHQDRQATRLSLRQDDLNEAKTALKTAEEESERVFGQAAETVAFHRAQELKRQATESNTDELAALFKQLKDKYADAHRKYETVTRGFNALKTQRDQARSKAKRFEEDLTEVEQERDEARFDFNDVISVDNQRSADNVGALAVTIASTGRRIRRGFFIYLGPNFDSEVEDLDDVDCSDGHVPSISELLANAHESGVETKKKLGNVVGDLKESKRREGASEQKLHLLTESLASGRPLRRVGVMQVSGCLATAAPFYNANITELEAPIATSLGSISAAKTVKTRFGAVDEAQSTLRRKIDKLESHQELLCTLAASGRLRRLPRLQHRFRAPAPPSRRQECFLEDIPYAVSTSANVEGFVVDLGAKLDREMSERHLLHTLVHSGHMGKSMKSFSKRFEGLSSLQPPQFESMDDGFDETTLPEVRSNETLLSANIAAIRRNSKDSSVHISNLMQEVDKWQKKFELVVQSFGSGHCSIPRVVSPPADIKEEKLCLPERSRHVVEVINMPILISWREFPTVVDETVAGCKRVGGLEADLRLQQGLVEELRSSSWSLAKSWGEKAKLNADQISSIAPELSDRTREYDDIIELEEMDIANLRPNLTDTVSNASSLLKAASAQLVISKDGLVRRGGTRRIEPLPTSAEIPRPTATAISGISDTEDGTVEFEPLCNFNWTPLRSQALDNMNECNSSKLRILGESLSRYGGRLGLRLGQWDVAKPKPVSTSGVSDNTDGTVDLEHDDWIKLSSFVDEALTKCALQNSKVKILHQSLPVFDARCKIDLERLNVSKLELAPISGDSDNHYGLVELDAVNGIHLSDFVDDALANSSMEISKSRIIRESLPAYCNRSRFDRGNLNVVRPNLPSPGGVVDLDQVNEDGWSDFVHDAFAKSSVEISKAKIIHKSLPLHGPWSPLDAERFQVSKPASINFPGMSGEDGPVDFEQYHSVEFASPLDDAVSSSETMRETMASKLAVTQHELVLYRSGPTINSRRLEAGVPKPASAVRTDATEFEPFEPASFDSVLLQAVSATKNGLDGTRRKLELAQELIERSDQHHTANTGFFEVVARVPTSEEFQEEDIDDFESLGFDDVVVPLLADLPAQAKNLLDANTRVSLLTRLAQDGAPRQTLHLAELSAKATMALESLPRLQSIGDVVQTQYSQTGSSFNASLDTAMSIATRRSTEGEIAREMCHDLHRAQSQQRQVVKSRLSGNKKKARESLQRHELAPEYGTVVVANDTGLETSLKYTRRGIRTLRTQHDEAVNATSDLLAELQRQQAVSMNVLRTAQETQALSNDE